MRRENAGDIIPMSAAVDVCSREMSCIEFCYWKVRKWRNKDIFCCVLWRLSEVISDLVHASSETKAAYKWMPNRCYKIPLRRSRCRWMVVGLLQLVWNGLWWWGGGGGGDLLENHFSPCLDHRSSRDSCQNQQTRSICRYWKTWHRVGGPNWVRVKSVWWRNAVQCRHSVLLPQIYPIP